MNNIFEEFRVHMSATVDVTESSHFKMNRLAIFSKPALPPTPPYKFGQS